MDPWVELAKTGPMVLAFGYAIVALWKENKRLQAEKEALHERVFRLFVSAAGLEESTDA